MEKKITLSERFNRCFERAMKKAVTDEKKQSDKPPKYDVSNGGGFTEPKDDGIQP